MLRRQFLSGSAALGAGTFASPLVRAQARRLRFGVGPFMPTAQDTRKAFLPLFAHIAKGLGAPDFDLAVSTDWAGLAIAMGSGQLDAAWMGPWGYVIANAATDCSRCNASSASACWSTPRSAPTRSRADNSSGWRSRGRWPSSRG